MRLSQENRLNSKIQSGICRAGLKVRGKESQGQGQKGR